jgi:uracil-DNA glycosylase family 4
VKLLRSIQKEVVGCRLCPRLVRHREATAAAKTRRFANEDYWGRPVPSFGDPGARLLVVGLAPAAHGGNRTGRMFTGDRSGDWLYEALHRFGFASQPSSISRFDGLRLDDAYITAVARCAPPGNKPAPDEIAMCRRYLLGELRILELRAVIALGRIAFDGFLGAWQKLGQTVRPRPGFAHGSEHVLDSGVRLLGSYHPSQQNTFTGRLTRPMFHRVFRRARRILDLD